MKCAYVWIKWIIGLIAVAVLLAGLFVKSGVYNCATTYPDPAPVAWVLDQTMTHSVQRHAAGIKVPPLGDPEMVNSGFTHYRQMCAGCHGAPGVSMAAMFKGLNPAPPKLVESVTDWKPNELFWIAKNGVRMTAMPGFGASHSDQVIWDIVAFLEKLPSLTPEQYKSLDRQVPAMRD